MTRARRILYAGLLLVLGALAARPYFPAIRETAADFLETWHRVRAGDRPTRPTSDAEANANERGDKDAEATKRRRAVLRPETGTEAGDGAEDPRAAEIRRRVREDPVAAMRWASTELRGPERLRGMLEVVALWAADDPEEAMLWLESNASGIARLETLDAGVRAWARENPRAAGEWIRGMAADASKTAAARALVAGWARGDPGAAAQWVAELPAGPVRDEAARALVETWGGTAPAAAAEWALARAEFSGNTGLLRRAVDKLTARSPDDAASFVREIADTRHGEAARDALAEAWVRHDPEGLAAYLSENGGGGLLGDPAHARLLAGEWSRTDSVAASEWLSQLPDGPRREQAIIGFAETMITFDPSAAAAWSNTLRYPDARSEWLRRSVGKWAQRRPEEAAEWLETAEMAPDLRRSLAELVGRPDGSR